MVDVVVVGRDRTDEDAVFLDRGDIGPRDGRVVVADQGDGRRRDAECAVAHPDDVGERADDGGLARRQEGDVVRRHVGQAAVGQHHAARQVAAADHGLGVAGLGRREIVEVDVGGEIALHRVDGVACHDAHDLHAGAAAVVGQDILARIETAAQRLRAVVQLVLAQGQVVRLGLRREFDRDRQPAFCSSHKTKFPKFARPRPSPAFGGGSQPSLVEFSSTQSTDGIPCPNARDPIGPPSQRTRVTYSAKNLNSRRNFVRNEILCSQPCCVGCIISLFRQRRYFCFEKRGLQYCWRHLVTFLLPRRACVCCRASGFRGRPSPSFSWICGPWLLRQSMRTIAVRLDT